MSNIAVLSSIVFISSVTVMIFSHSDAMVLTIGCILIYSTFFTILLGMYIDTSWKKHIQVENWRTGRYYNKAENKNTSFIHKIFK